jgi:hypothetical protein
VTRRPYTLLYIYFFVLCLPLVHPVRNPPTPPFDSLDPSVTAIPSYSVLAVINMLVGNCRITHIYALILQHIEGIIRIELGVRESFFSHALSLFYFPLRLQVVSRRPRHRRRTVAVALISLNLHASLTPLPLSFLVSMLFSPLPLGYISTFLVVPRPATYNNKRESSL